MSASNGHGPQQVDFDLHGLAGIRLVGASPHEVAASIAYEEKQPSYRGELRRASRGNPEALVLIAYPGDGVGSFMEPIAKGVAALGHEVHLVAPWHPAITRGREEDGVFFHFYRYAPIASLNVFGYASGLRADTDVRAAAFTSRQITVDPVAGIAVNADEAAGAVAQALHAEKLILLTPSPRYIDDAGYRGGFSAEDIDESKLKSAVGLERSERDEEWGDLAIRLFLDYVVEQIRPIFYNRGVDDAQRALRGLEDRRVFDRTDDEAVPLRSQGLGDAEERKVVRLGRAGGEGQPLGVAPVEVRDRLARVLDRLARRAARRVDAGGIRERGRAHRLAGLGPDARGRRVVEVDHRGRILSK